MFGSEDAAYYVRPATEADEQHLLRLSILDSQRELTRPALIGEIDGKPAAAMSLSTGRIVTDPFACTASLMAHLRVRAHAVRTRPRETLTERLLHGTNAPRQPRFA